MLLLKHYHVCALTNTWNSEVNSFDPIKFDVLHAWHDSTGYPIMDKWPI